MRLSDLRDATIKTEAGDKLGRVHEVHCDNGRVVALMYGPGSLIERLSGKREGGRVPWENVRRVSAGIVIVADPLRPRSSSKVSEPRTRPGTRRPSGRQSKR